MNLPNSITLSRLLGLPAIIYCLYSDSVTTRWVGLAVFLVAALTDWLDGYLARKLDLVTDLGKFLDPLVDKLLILIPLLILIDLHLAPAIGSCLILARELTVAGWRVVHGRRGSLYVRVQPRDNVRQGCGSASKEARHYGARLARQRPAVRYLTGSRSHLWDRRSAAHLDALFHGEGRSGRA